MKTGVGVVDEFDEPSQAGIILTADGDRIRFSYPEGESMLLESNSICPHFSGRHEQPSGYSLKEPKTGDAIIFVKERSAIRWSYVDHFLRLTTKRFGTDFLSKTKEKDLPEELKFG